MNREIITTEDGSNTLYVPELNEHYHSTFGALNESSHVFIDAGLSYISDNLKEISIFEVGFGTGLNALLTYLKAKEENIKINYTTVEAFPIEDDILSTLNYSEKIDKTAFNKIHNASWDIQNKIDINFSINKIKSKLQDFNTSEKFDIIYFDAFSPDVQPELWSEEIFIKMYNLLNNNGILTTYCAKGKVKRALKSAGFLIEGLPGPKGKREITRATKS